MSARALTNEIDDMVTGIEVQEAVDLTVAYIKRKHKFLTPEAAYGFWAGLNETEKLDLLRKALSS